MLNPESEAREHRCEHGGVVVHRRSPTARSTGSGTNIAGVVFEVAFNYDQQWEVFRGLPSVQAALDGVPDPVNGLLVWRGAAVVLDQGGVLSQRHAGADTRPVALDRPAVVDPGPASQHS